MDNEIWKDIPGYEGRYQASSLGRIRCLNYHRMGITCILKQRLNTNDYYFVLLYKNGSRKFIGVHRLVCAAFHENPNRYPCVNHKDEDHHNNRADNLEWCTHKYNSNYGTCQQRIDEKRFRRPVSQYSEDGVFLSTFESLGEAARKTGLGIGDIWSCCAGRCFFAGGYIWVYFDDKNKTQKVADTVTRKAQCKVIQLSLDGLEVYRFRNAKIASKLTGVDHSSILKCMKGKRKSAGGYVWKLLKT